MTAMNQVVDAVADERASRQGATTLLVIAKEPLPGRAKTRLCPPCTPAQAAALAGAALRDTLGVVSRAPAVRRVLVFEGDGDAWCPAGWEWIPQRGDGLGERLAAAFADVDEPALLVGMDTPQLTPCQLASGLAALGAPDVDAVLGPTHDGGYWSIGLCRADAEVFRDVPMSSVDTCTAQRRRLLELGLRLHEQPLLRDVDTFRDAELVSAEAPGTEFARALAGL